ncbi:MAG: PTS sugar transporter subunit IIB [Solobacterium sp.]|nr:PTS sugar transporter subunit IIB [Lachnospiraceae bacterium]MCI6696713.1 PTS sugar transporter subunit IIB [Solobacterium sp.]MDY4791562.1 PTS sugar transporter subunit IIB [Erysipelotrichaceae bacterium]MCI6846093.1 PTS sugar transporter subunit IIB [Solobacterium sp.]MCI7156549.1 PTS sugar transporter subunit IIB [Solobacterium sp.]
MDTKKALIMCRTGMGSSMMLKIKVDKLIDKNKYPLDVTHDAFSGFAGQQNVDIIITMEDLIDEFKDSSAYVIGVKDIMDVDYLERELNKYFESQKQ